jgi:hypothetical protein
MSTESKNSPSMDSDSENQPSNAFEGQHAIKKNELYHSRGNYSRLIDNLQKYKNNIPSEVLIAQSGDTLLWEKENHRIHINSKIREIEDAEKDMIKKYRILRHFEKDTQKNGSFPQMKRITHTPLKGKGIKYMQDIGERYPLKKKIPKQIGGKKKRKTHRRKRKTHRRKRKTHRRKRKTHRRKRKTHRRKRKTHRRR